jgi:flagellin-like protein
MTDMDNRSGNFSLCYFNPKCFYMIIKRVYIEICLRGGNMKANKKLVEEDEAVSAVIGVILMVAITVAIAATVYVYVSGLASSPGSNAEHASVGAEATDDQIKLVLAAGGDDYDDGYTISAGSDNEVNVFVNGSKATLTPGTWETGGQVLLGLNAGSWTQGTDTCPADDYTVTVSIKNTVVYDGTLTVR